MVRIKKRASFPKTMASFGAASCLLLCVTCFSQSVAGYDITLVFEVIPTSVIENEWFSIRVTDGQKAVADVNVIIRLSEGFSQVKPTDDEGKVGFFAPSVPIEGADLIVTADKPSNISHNYIPATGSIHIENRPESLEIIAPDEVAEGTQFIVTATANSIPVYGVNVIFDTTQHLTDLDGEARFRATFVEQNKVYQLTAELEGYLPAQRPITVTNNDSTLPTLSINAPDSLVEGILLRVMVTSAGSPVVSALVTFGDARNETNSQGYVSFITPRVNEDTTLELTASKTGFQSIAQNIIIIDSPETLETYIEGYVTDPSGVPLVDVRVCVEGSSSCSYTDYSGRYHLATNPGIYSINAEKEGYTTTIIYNIQVLINQIRSVNMTIESLPSPTEQQFPFETEAVILQWAIDHARIGAAIKVSSESASGKVYQPNLSITNLSSSKTNVGLTIAGPEGRNGTTIVFQVLNSEDIISTIVKDPSQIQITYDGRQIPMVASIDSFLQAPSSSEPSWAVLITQKNVYLLVNIPHFSTHELVCSFADVAAKITLVTFIIICTGTVLVFISPIFIRFAAVCIRGKKET